MVDDAEQDQKTEAPTGRRLSEAREKSPLPTSREVSTWFSFIAILIVISWLAPSMMTKMMAGLRVFLERPEQISLDGNGLQAALYNVVSNVGFITIIVFCLLASSMVIGFMSQTGFYVNVNKLTPNFAKLSPISGIKQLLSLSSLVELVKSFIKLFIVGAVVLFVYYPLISILPGYTGHDLVEVLLFARAQIVHLIVVLLLIVTVIAIGDLLFQRYRYFKSLRMTKTEVKDEQKMMDMDPLIKNRLRQIRLEKARKRMIAQVPKADVVITNPTHYAIALQYDNNKMSAPIVLAKGVDKVATRIREVAEENAVPLVSNPPLARALYETVDIDEAISPAHYRAVAEVISYVYKLKKKKS